MADQKISELVQINIGDLADEDEFVIADASESDNKSVTWGEMRRVSQSVIYVDTVSDLTGLDTSALPDGQQVSVAGGDFSALFVYDAESTATADNWTIIEPSSETGRWFLVAGILQADITANIPSDFPDLQTALDRLSKIRSVSGCKVFLNLESGFVLTHAYHITSGTSYSHFEIISEDSEVIANADNGGSLTVFGTTGAFLIVEETDGPVWNILVDAQNSGPSDIKGMVVVGSNASMTISGGAGLKNLGDRASISGPEPTQYGFGLLVWNGANVRANGAIISGAAQRNLWVSRNARITAANADLSAAQGGLGPDPQDSGNHGGAYVTRGSWANLEGCNFNGGAHRAVTAIRSFINLDNAEILNMGADTPVMVERGGQIVASYVTFDGPNQQDFCNVDLNTVHGRGTIYAVDYSEQDKAIRSFSSPSQNGNYIRFADGTQICYIPGSATITLEYNSSTELRATWNFPIEFVDNNYSVHITVNGRPNGKRGVGDLASFSYNTDSVDLAIQGNTGDFSSGDTADVVAVVYGRWK